MYRTTYNKTSNWHGMKFSCMCIYTYLLSSRFFWSFSTSFTQFDFLTLLFFSSTGLSLSTDTSAPGGISSLASAPAWFLGNLLLNSFFTAEGLDCGRMWAESSDPLCEPTRPLLFRALLSATGLGIFSPEFRPAWERSYNRIHEYIHTYVCMYIRYAQHFIL